VHQAKYEGHHQEIHDGRLRSNVDANDYDYSVGRGRGQRVCGPEGVLEHDRLSTLLDGDEADIQFSLC
jgi:hypothetical protein